MEKLTNTGYLQEALWSDFRTEVKFDDYILRDS
jgi:hypothetical protein